MIDTKTPDNIDEYSIDDVYKLVKDQEGLGLPSPRARLRVIKMIFDILGYDLTSDLALALCAEPKAQLVLSIAGGGKTTGAQLKAICEKIWRKSKHNKDANIRGNNILCLVYNRHNVQPMIDKHRELVSRLRLAPIKGFDIDDNINASTMHSFCDQWRKENVAALGLMGYTLLTDDESERLLHTVANRIFQKYEIKDKSNVVPNILSLHNLAKESLCPIRDLEGTDKFIDIELDVEILEEISELYEKMKKMKKKYDFTDMLVGVYKLLVERPEIVENVQKYYDYIIADEVQDFTPIMLKILHILISDGTPLMCIGDDDQSIYKFRGADIYHTLHFSEEFDGGEVYLLSRNRRCRENILKLGNQVISENKLRYKKQMRGVKPGGVVEYVPYNSVESENLNVFSKIRALSEAELDDSVVCYRERVSSIMLAELLEENKIPFHVISGYGAFSHELYAHVIHVLNLLESPLDPYCLLNLYKCTPMKKSQVQQALGFNPEKGRFVGDREKVHFAKIDFGAAMNIKGLDKDMEFLAQVSAIMPKVPMSAYFDELFKRIKKYFWNYQKGVRGLPEVYDDFIEDKIYKIFNVDKTYAEVFADFSKRKDLCRINQQQKYGLAISTFHGLKGLEYSNVFILDLDDTIFPNFNFIERKSYDEATKQLLKECETCLYYVAVTRAKDNLYLYYNESSPSRYVTLYNPDLRGKHFENITETANYMKLFEAESVVDSIAEVAEVLSEVSVIDDSFDSFDSFDSLIEEDVVVEEENCKTDTEVADDYFSDIFDSFEDDCEDSEVSQSSTSELEKDSVELNGSGTFNSFLSNLLDF